MKIRKAVIPAAGLGTRFLPATKALPKEMLPIVDIPTIQLIVEEAVAAGIEEILIITNSNKHSLENHFDVAYELEHRLMVSGKTDLAKQVRDIAFMANISYIRQKEPKGLGHAILCAKEFVGDEPFAILLGDDLVVAEDETALGQLIAIYDKTASSVIGVQEVDIADTKKYGIIAGVQQSNNLYLMNGIVEKPIENPPSRLAAMGRYILTPAIFNILDNQPPGKGGEIQLTDAIKVLLDLESVYAYNFSGIRYDVGDRFGFVKATIDFALGRSDIGEEVKSYIKEIAKKL